MACHQSIKRLSSPDRIIQTLDTDVLRRCGIYQREKDVRGRQAFDVIDNKPYSTDFAFSRFLIPALLGQQESWVVFCDDDFLWRESPDGLLPLLDGTKAVMVVKHEHNPPIGPKMDGQTQTQNRRKNWSSMIVWNLAHPSNRRLTVTDANTASVVFLHQFGWLQDDEIGELPEKWNWLEGHSSSEIDPAAVHYTRGGPWLQAYRHTAYADEWLGVHFSSLNEVAQNYSKSVILAFGG